MVWFIVEGFISFVLSLFGAIYGCMTSDTLAGTTYIAPPRTKRQRKLEPQQPSTVVQPGRHDEMRGASRERSVSLSDARDVDEALQRRRVELCKYFGAATLAALCVSVGAWDRWPLLWLLRVECVIIFFCALVKGPAALSVDFIRIPLTAMPWFVALDFFFFNNNV